jgi:hypothetical protein
MELSVGFVVMPASLCLKSPIELELGMVGAAATL